MIRATDYPGYLVNENGQVFSTMRGEMVEIKIQSFDKRYATVTVTLATGHAKKKIPVRVHRLVASAFLDNPNCYSDVNHKDGNKLNNSVLNLEWCTRAENLQHAYRTGLKHEPKTARQCVAISKKSGVMHEFRSAAMAAKKCRKKNNSNILKALNGSLSTSCGFYWVEVGVPRSSNPMIRPGVAGGETV